MRFMSHTVFNIIVLLISSTKLFALDYCGKSICEGNGKHTLCKYKVDGPAGHCIDYTKTVLNEDDKKAILHKINKRRNTISAGEVRSYPKAANMRKLIWNEELSVSAQRWADQCVKHSTPDVQDDCRDLRDVLVGQNVATVVGDAPGLTPASLIDVWYMELLDVNASIIPYYQRSPEISQTHQAYFTQFVWAETFQVGCGGVKFRENYTNFGKYKSRILHRVVCNFAPKGNIDGESVYEIGIPCSKCDNDCDTEFPALCLTDVDYHVDAGNEEVTKKASLFSTEVQDSITETSITVPYTYVGHHDAIGPTSLLPSKNEYNWTQYDFLSHLFEITKEPFIKSVTDKPCKNDLVIDDLLNLIKKKLREDPAFNNLVTTNKNLEDTSTDREVENFINKLYKSKFTTTTPKMTEIDNFNSTSLVNLVEAVIFRNTGKYVTPSVESSTEISTHVNSVKMKQVQVELAQTKINNEFDGHYFFPEEEEEEEGEIETEEEDEDDSNKKVEIDYNIKLPPSEILAEIDNIKRKSEVEDFLEDILETEETTESTKISTTSSMSPDDLGLVKYGYNNMKRFLDEIAEKKNTIHFGTST